MCPIWFHVRRDFERLKLVSPLDVADIAIGPKIDENGQRRVTTADGNPDFDLSTDLEPESRIRQAKEEQPRRQPVFLRRVGDPL